MRTVRTAAGKRYVLVKRSAESSLVRDPETGAERYLPNADLSVIEEVSPLRTAAEAVSPPVRRVLTATPNDRALGLLVELADRGPLAVRTLLDAYDLCESDLHGLLTEFRAAGLLEEASVAGERGYDATARTREAVTTLRTAAGDDAAASSEQ
jgi:hypothetical protein